MTDVEQTFSNALGRSSIAGATYFLAVFAAGFLLGPIRQFLLVPQIGEVAGVLLEAPLMLAASWFAAWWTIGRFAVPARLAPRAEMGLTAFALLMLAEMAGALLLRGLTFAGWCAHFLTAPGAVSLGLFLVFAAAPLVVRMPQRY